MDLHAGFQKSLTSPFYAFVFARMGIRRLHAEMNSAYAQIRSMQRTKAKLEEKASPFDSARITSLGLVIGSLQAGQKENREILRGMGEYILQIGYQIDAFTTLEERFELLNCNVADRPAVDDEHSGMTFLMGAYCVEDSAEHRRDQSNDRPLHAAVNAHIQHVMFSTPEGRKATDGMFEKLFEPGGLFEGVPTYTRTPDGEMHRNPPKLVCLAGGGAQ